MSNQSQLNRVAERISADVVLFCTERLKGTPQFHAEDLRSAIGPRSAPGSADRMLRRLRKGGVVNYVVLNRAQSLYEVQAVDPDAAEAAAVEVATRSVLAVAATIADDDGYVPTTNAVPEGATLEEWEAPDPDQKPW